MSPIKPVDAFHFGASACLIGLIFLGLAWELWLAPLRPGGSLLALKILPLLLPLFGILRGKIYTFQWSTMLALAYVAEGVVRTWSDHGLSALLAFAESVLACAFFFSCIGYVRLARRQT